jgi:hypothetical protein
VLVVEVEDEVASGGVPTTSQGSRRRSTIGLTSPRLAISTRGRRRSSLLSPGDAAARHLKSRAAVQLQVCVCVCVCVCVYVGVSVCVCGFVACAPVGVDLWGS